MTSADTTIRRATPTDRATVLRFHHALYIDHRDLIVKPEVLPLFAYRDMEGTLRDDVAGLLHNRDSTVLLAERAGVAIGYISGHIEVDPRRVLERRGVIEDWYVETEQRGSGVGSLLLAQLEALFRARGCDLVESGTWGFNQGARAAHARAGFVEIEVKFRKRL